MRKASARPGGERDGHRRAARDNGVMVVSGLNLIAPGGHTFYAVASDWFAWLCVAFVVLLPVARWRGFNAPRNHRPRG